MILPIYLFGHPILKKETIPVPKDYPDLDVLIENMWETMYNAKGVGLAAPQIGLNLRLFVVDSTQMESEEHDWKGIKQVFINAQMIEESGEEWPYEEGCLSIPEVRGDVIRQESIQLTYMDENFVGFKGTFHAANARVIQHEYDHIEGELFTEKLKPLKKRLIKRRLESIKKGKLRPEYPSKTLPPKRR